MRRRLPPVQPAQQSPPAYPLPRIGGYEVSLGRALLHARYVGTPAQARQEGRPWHVVAPTPMTLVEAVNHGRREAP
jgi:hypothetical protein